ASLTLASCSLGDRASNGDEEAGGNSYPSGEITLLVPYAAGGGTDTIARTLAPFLEDELGGSILVENREGGAGAVATNAVIAAENDGYTILMAAASPTIATPLFDEVGYVPEDLSPIGRAVAAPNVLVVTEASPYQSSEEFFNAAKSG